MKILEKNCESFEIINYIKEGITKEQINEILNLLNIKPIEIIRRSEKQFKKLNLKESQLEDNNILTKAIVDFPKIIQRPIIINNDKAVIGRPPENIYKIL